MLMHSHCASLIYAQDICRATWPAADHAPRWPKIVWVTSASNHTFNETLQRWLIVPSFPTSKPVLFPFRELGKTDQEPKNISNDWKTASQGVNVRGKGLTCKRPPSCTLSKRSPRSSRLPETAHGNPEGGWRYVPKIHWLLWTLWNSQVVFHKHSLNELGPISRRRYRQECHSGFSAVSRG